MLQNELNFDLIAFSPHRWSNTPSRPQQLVTGFARYRRVFFVEEPLHGEFERPFLKVSQKSTNLQAATPCLPQSLGDAEKDFETHRLLEEWIRQEDIFEFTSWYFTPSALRYSAGLEPEVIVYHRPKDYEANEDQQTEILEVAQLVFIDLHLQDAPGETELLQRELQLRESQKVPAMAFLNAKKRGTLVAPSKQNRRS